MSPAVGEESHVGLGDHIFYQHQSINERKGEEEKRSVGQLVNVLTPNNTIKYYQEVAQ